ncbi:thiamine phosphate synthase [Bogoriella caseilytica]|uniref:Thiamine-phosphate synthase n=1 Tax=Bogoriella caseilytica TaxID=56055 RepID=A0A3N2BC88_9MICO|nr:thiamine phosphate synthase [Bogoriella caseilytica]ROR72838.1 thiamine-phosphate diphosphorylase [Bogoriella caseilytica]
MTLDLSLYLVTDTGLCGQRGVPETVREAVAGGVSVVQLRDHALDDRAFVALGQAVRAELDALHRAGGPRAPLIVDDRVHLVSEIGADGAHVGQADLPVPQARELLGPHGILGLSVTHAGQLEVAREHGRAVDYLGLGPVWATATKPGHAAPFGPEGLAELAAASPWPTVAIGGIDAAGAATLRGTGVAGIAVVSAICGQPSPREAAVTLRQVWAGSAQGVSA